MQTITYNYKAHKNTGFSLIELMLSIIIGSFLILGAAFAFQEAQKVYSVNDNIARLQEQAQFVLDTLEEDVRMSNFWGLHNVTSAVVKDGTIAQLELDGISGDCEGEGGGSWALDLSLGIYGTNNVNPALVDDTTTRDWGRGRIVGVGCISPASKYQNGTDSLVVRHAGNNIVAPVDLKAGKVYVSSNESPQSILFTATGANDVPASAGITDKIFELRTHGYYVRNYSFEDADLAAIDDIPMLRRITLVDSGTAPAVQDREISSGVQDFQVEFGIDTSAFDSAERGSINGYVSPDSSLLDNADTQILSVRVWVLMQALNQEQNFNNTDTYSYAGIDTKVDDAYRRLLVNRTFQVRNMLRTSL